MSITTKTNINMKNLIVVLLVVLTALVGAATVQAQEFPKPDNSPLDISYYPPRVAFRAFGKTEAEKNAEPVIRVIYSRPQAKGRKVFTELEKPGNIWRLGANEATEVMFFQDVTIGDTKVKAGRYTAYVQLAENEWMIPWQEYLLNCRISMNLKKSLQDSFLEAFLFIKDAITPQHNLLM